MALDIHNRIEHIIDSERLSISAFERQIGVGRNSISTSLRKKSSISHEVIKKFTFTSLTTLWTGLFLGMKMNRKLK